MFGNKDTKVEAAPTPSRDKKIGSVIGERVTFNGTLRVEGSIVINGEVEGSITCTEHLVVGRTGRVRADLDVGSATIGGWVEGRIFAKDRVELQTDSHLVGDVHTKSFVIQDGCFFQGNCAMGEAHEAQQRIGTLEETPRPKIEVA